MDWPVLLLSLGIVGLLALAIYGIVTGKGRGGSCSCGTGFCGRPVDQHHKDDEKLSARRPPDEMSVEDVEKEGEKGKREKVEKDA